MKILLLTQYFPPEFGAAAARNAEHARLWAEAGHDVEVLTGFPNYPEGVIHPEYKGKRFLKTEQDGYRLHRTWLHAAPNRSVFQRAAASLSFMASALLSGCLRCQRPDVIVASSGPFFVGPLGYLLSLFKRAPFVFEARDLLPQQAVDTGMLKNPILIRLLSTIEKFLDHRAAAIITVAPASRDALIERGIPPCKVHTIENGVNEAFFKPGPRGNALRDQHGWGEKFVALYAGAHGVSQGLGALLEAASALKGEADILFVFVGDGAAKPELMATAKEQRLDNVQFLPPLSKENMPDLYNAADVCLVPLRKGNYFEINIPSKLFEIMACGRPIVLGAKGQARALLEAPGAGIAVDPEDAAAYAEAIRRLRDEGEAAAQFGKGGRAHVTEHFTRAKKARAYLEILERL